MFRKLMEGLRHVSNPYKGFLGELWTVWTHDAGRAVLMARWFWQNLPKELMQQATAIQQQTQAAQAMNQIDQQVNLQLGSMGIFPGSAGNASFGFGMNPDHALFISIMGMIRAHNGDPPASQQLVQLAEPVLRGQMDPYDALIASAPPLTQQQLAAAVQMMKMMGADNLLRLQAVIQVACALPRERIPVLVPEVERMPVAEVEGPSRRG